jgi:hypothetical protein
MASWLSLLWHWFGFLNWNCRRWSIRLRYLNYIRLLLYDLRFTNIAHHRTAHEKSTGG